MAPADTFARQSKEQRPDDNAETLKKRFATHTQTCLPVLEHYKQKGKLRQVCDENEEN